MAKIDWTQAKKDYIGDERMSYRAIARKYGVSKVAVANRATREGWPKLRQNLNDRAIEKFEDRKTERVAEVTEEHAADYRLVQELVETHLEKMKADQEAGREVDVGDLWSLSRALRTAVEGERVCLGLPNRVSEPPTERQGLTDLFRLAQAAEESRRRREGGESDHPAGLEV